MVLEDGRHQQQTKRVKVDEYYISRQTKWKKLHDGLPNHAIEAALTCTVDPIQYKAATSNILEATMFLLVRDHLPFHFCVPDDAVRKFEKGSPADFDSSPNSCDAKGDQHGFRWCHIGEGLLPSRLPLAARL